MTTTETSQKILDAAEMLFAEHGFGDVSIRQVVQEAGVNVASIHYYFGSKEALIEEVLTRRLGPLNEERLAELERAEQAAEASGEGPTLEAVLEALLRPAIRLSRSGDGENNFVRLVGRLFSEPNSTVRSMVESKYEAVFGRFLEALRRASPGIKRKDFFWRIHFFLGAMSLTLCDRERPAIFSGGACDSDDVEEVVAQLVTFCAGGMRADAAKKRRKS